VLFGWSASAAFADGDPASDVLATQALFLPADADLSVAQDTRLAALMTAADHSGYQVRVAIVASATDLGSVGVLWRRPRLYAEFLGQELLLIYRGPLLVIMPNGLGLYDAEKPAAAGQSALAGIPAPAAGGGALATAAITAVRDLAAAAGHPVSVPRLGTQPSARPTSSTTWVVLALGAALIIAAWTASLRARPLRSAGAP